jgi:hypothetical protein
MKLIGLSLGGCLSSLMRGEVSEDDVMFIVTRTNCPDFDRYIKVVEAYHSQGNIYSSNPERYELTDYPLEKVTDLATRARFINLGFLSGTGTVGLTVILPSMVMDYGWK